MSPRIGFSTGAIAFSDFEMGLRLLLDRGISVVELSALRDKELRPLLAALDRLPLERLSYVSFHAPSSLTTLTEVDVVGLLQQVVPRRWPIILHPDVISDFSMWTQFGEWLCIENMDKRKPIGRTVAELEPIFERLPDASFCFDIGHARQVDPTMIEAADLLKAFGHRLKEVHMSEVPSNSKHESMSMTAISAFRKIAHLIPPDVPIVLESVVSPDQIDREVKIAGFVLSRAAAVA